MTDHVRRHVDPAAAAVVDGVTARLGAADAEATSAGGSPHGRRDGSQPSYEGCAERPPRPGSTFTIAAAGDAGSPGDVSSPDVTRASRETEVES